MPASARHAGPGWDHDWDKCRSWPALGLILALHAGALWGLLQVDAVRQAVQQVAPIMVGLITLPPPEPPRPRIEPPPRPAPPKARAEPQMIAAQTQAQAPIAAPAPEPLPAEPPPPAEAPLAVVPPDFLAAYLDNPRPVYPANAKRLRQTGRVLLRVLVNVEGRPDRVEVETGSGYDMLDRAALDAVRRWKFVPARQGDQAIAATVLVPIQFELNSR